MEEIYQIVYKEGTAQLIEKKSKFLAVIKPIKTEAEAIEVLEEVRKQYYDASHHCYAYIVEEQSELMRFGDDGEPTGTAGKPMLEVMLGNHLHNAVAVVTRYFGGTLLGKGGLVRAYSGALKEAIDSSVIITRKTGVKLQLTTDYAGVGKLQYIFRQNGIKIIDTIYTEQVELYAAIPKEIRGDIIADITEATNGQVQIVKEEACYFAEIDAEIVIY